MATSRSEFDGIVVVDKPAGMTSHDIVNRMRRLFRTRRVGHTGTLDPDATGVLVICIGQATRLAEYLTAASKAYTASAVFGIRTDSQDASGVTLSTTPADNVTADTLAAVLPRFRGVISQVPPMVSAVHHEGRRLYELAREGVTVERESRQIRIYELDALEFTPGTHPVAQLQIVCSTGTYIRTLIADIGDALGVGAIMSSLRRDWVGYSEVDAFTVARSHTLEELEVHARDNSLATCVLPMEAAVDRWPRLLLQSQELERIRNGQQIPLADLSRTCDGDSGDAEAVAIMNEQGTLCAVGRIGEGRLIPVKVLAQT